MGCTTGLLIGDVIKYKIKIVTHPIAHPADPGMIIGIDIQTYQCNDEWIPSALLGTNVQNDTESNYHQNIRKGAIEKGTFVKEESTNPELNYFDVED